MCLLKFQFFLKSKNLPKKIFLIQQRSMFSAKEESIFLIDCKNNFHTSSTFFFPKLVEQKQKFYLFYHYLLWQEGEIFKTDYLLKMLLVFKKQRLSTVLSTSKAYSLLDLFAIKRYASLIIAFLDNQFFLDVDSLNPRFLIFFYFLTRLHKHVNSNLFSEKKKKIFRNIFFLFIFIIYRLKFFFKISSCNLIFSSNYLSKKNNYKTYKTRFPRRLFLIFYSPFKVSYNHGLSLSLFRRRQIFLKRLYLFNSILFSSKLNNTRKKLFNDVINKSLIVLTDQNKKVNLNSKKFKKFLQMLFQKLKKKSFCFIKLKKIKTISLNFSKNKKLKFIRSSFNYFIQFNNFKNREKNYFVFKPILSYNLKLKIYSFFFAFIKKLYTLIHGLIQKLNFEYFFYFRPFVSKRIFNLIKYLKQILMTWIIHLQFSKYSLYTIKCIYSSGLLYYVPKINNFYNLITKRIKKPFQFTSNFLFENIVNFDNLNFFFSLRSTYFFRKHNNNNKLQNKFYSFFSSNSRNFFFSLNSVKEKKLKNIETLKNKKFTEMLILPNLGLNKYSYLDKSLCLNNNRFFSYKSNNQKKNILFLKKQFLNFFFFPILKRVILKVNNFFNLINLIIIQIFPGFFFMTNLKVILFQIIKKSFFYPYLIIYLIKYFLIMFVKFKSTLTFSSYQEIFKMILFSKFYPLILNLNNFFFDSDFIKLSKSINFIDDLLLELVEDNFKLLNFNKLQMIFNKRKVLFSKLGHSIRGIRLKALPYKHLTVIQQDIFDSENRALLDYDAKEFISNFSHRFKISFFNLKQYKISSISKNEKNLNLISFLIKILQKRIKNQKRKKFLENKKIRNVWLRLKFYLKKKEKQKYSKNKNFKFWLKKKNRNKYKNYYSYKIKQFKLNYIKNAKKFLKEDCNEIEILVSNKKKNYNKTFKKSKKIFTILSSFKKLKLLNKSLNILRKNANKYSIKIEYEYKNLNSLLFKINDFPFSSLLIKNLKKKNKFFFGLKKPQLNHPSSKLLYNVWGFYSRKFFYLKNPFKKLKKNNKLFIKINDKLIKWVKLKKKTTLSKHQIKRLKKKVTKKLNKNKFFYLNKLRLMYIKKYSSWFGVEDLLERFKKFKIKKIDDKRFFWIFYNTILYLFFIFLKKITLFFKKIFLIIVQFNCMQNFYFFVNEKSYNIFVFLYQLVQVKFFFYLKFFLKLYYKKQLFEKEKYFKFLRNKYFFIFLRNKFTILLFFLYRWCKEKKITYFVKYYKLRKKKKNSKINRKFTKKIFDKILIILNLYTERFESRFIKIINFYQNHKIFSKYFFFQKINFRKLKTYQLNLKSYFLKQFKWFLQISKLKFAQNKFFQKQFFIPKRFEGMSYRNLLTNLKKKKLKLRRAIKFRKKKLFEKKKIYFLEKWRKMRRFFIQAFFFTRFIKNAEMPYRWNHYGQNVMRALRMFQFHSPFFFRLKFKSFFSKAIMNKSRFPIIRLLYRPSFLNASYNIKIFCNNPNFFFTNIIFKKKSSLNYLNVFFLNFDSKKNFSNFFYFKLQDYLIHWLPILKNFFFLVKNYSLNFYDKQLGEYLILILFFFKHGFMFLTFKLYTFLIETIYLYMFFEKIKSSFINLINYFTNFLFPVKYKYNLKLLSNKSKKLINILPLAFKFSTSFFHISKILFYSYNKKRRKRKTHTFFFRIANFEFSKIYTLPLINYTKNYLFSFFVTFNLHSILEWPKNSINYFFKIVVNFLFNSLNWLKYPLIKFQNKIFFAFPNFLYVLFLDKNFKLPISSQNIFSALYLPILNSKSYLGFFTFFYTEIIRRQFYLRKLKKITRLKYNAIRKNLRKKRKFFRYPFKFQKYLRYKIRRRYYDMKYYYKYFRRIKIRSYLRFQLLCKLKKFTNYINLIKKQKSEKKFRKKKFLILKNKQKYGKKKSILITMSNLSRQKRVRNKILRFIKFKMNNKKNLRFKNFFFLNYYKQNLVKSATLFNSKKQINQIYLIKKYKSFFRPQKKFNYLFFKSKKLNNLFFLYNKKKDFKMQSFFKNFLNLNFSISNIKIPKNFFFSKSVYFIFQYYKNLIDLKYLSIILTRIKKLKLLFFQFKNKLLINSNIINLFLSLINLPNYPLKIFFIKKIILFGLQRKQIILSNLTDYQNISNKKIQNLLKFYKIIIIKKINKETKIAIVNFQKFDSSLILKGGINFFFRFQNKFKSDLFDDISNLTLFKSKKSINYFFNILNNFIFKVQLQKLKPLKYFFIKPNFYLLKNFKLRRFLNLFFIVLNQIKYIYTFLINFNFQINFIQKFFCNSILNLINFYIYNSLLTTNSLIKQKFYYYASRLLSNFLNLFKNYKYFFYKYNNNNALINKISSKFLLFNFNFLQIYSTLVRELFILLNFYFSKNKFSKINLLISFFDINNIYSLSNFFTIKLKNIFFKQTFQDYTFLNSNNFFSLLIQSILVYLYQIKSKDKNISDFLLMIKFLNFKFEKFFLLDSFNFSKDKNLYKYLRLIRNLFRNNILLNKKKFSKFILAIKKIYLVKLQKYEFFNQIFLNGLLLLNYFHLNENNLYINYLKIFLFWLIKDNYFKFFKQDTFIFLFQSLDNVYSIPKMEKFNKIKLSKNINVLLYNNNKNLNFKKFNKFTLMPKNNYKEFFFLKTKALKINKFLLRKIISQDWGTFFGIEKFFLKKIFQFQKTNTKERKFNFKLLNKFKLKKLNFHLQSIKRSSKKFYFSILSKFHPIIKKKIFLDCFFSPRFFRLLNVKPKNLFLLYKSYNWLFGQFSLFSRINRLIQFLIKLFFLYKRNIKKKSSLFFLYLIKLYRRSKQILQRVLNQILSYIIRMKRVTITKKFISFSSSFFLLNNFRFSFFYNFLSTKFLRFFILRTNFPYEYLKFRLRFINRYLWFRVISIKQLVKKPKIYIIVTKVKNNFFLTGIDLFGRILYKCSPGMVGYTGTDRMSKYAWHDTAVDFFGGLIEFTRYFLKRRLRRRQGYFHLYKRRIASLRLTKVESLFRVRKFLLLSKRFRKKQHKYYFQTHQKIDFESYQKFLRKYQRKIERKVNRIKKKKKYLKTLRTFLRKFFIVSKGANNFNIRMIIKGMKQYKKIKIFRFFCGSLTFPMKSFSLCRIKKVRRI